MKIKKISKNEEFNKHELDIGLEVEAEHKDLYELVKKEFEKNNIEMPFTEEQFYSIISKGHLVEFKDYYTRLKKMEEVAKKELGLKD